MKKLYSFALLFLFAFVAKAQIVTIPDAHFKDFLIHYQETAIDTNGDGEVQVSEALAVTTLTLGYPANLSADLTGINAFSNLTSLSFSYCYSLTSLDLSGLSLLQSLDCSNNYNLVSLNIAGLTQLQTFTCAGNTNLSALNLSTLTQLKNLTYYGCYQLSSLDVSTLTQLESLVFGGNSIPTLNLSGLTNLQQLSCNSCYGLTTLDLSGLVNLIDFQCTDNLNIQSLDFSQCTQLKTLNCSGMSNLNSLNVSNLNLLTTLSCNLCTSLSTLNLSGLAALQYVDCSWSNLNNINLTGANAIVTLNLSNCHLTTINVSNLLQLQNLNISNNYTIPSLNLTGLTNLTDLRCNSNGMTVLNVNHLVNLIILECGGNSLTNIDVSALVHLETFYCADNQLTTLDVSNLTQLRQFNCGQNSLTTLTITPLVHLIEFGCYRNQLTTIDLSHQPALRNVDCSYNLFTTLDFGTMDSGVDVNNWPSIGFSHNPNLTYVNLKNGLFFSRYAGNIIEFSVGCDNLSYICADEESIAPMISFIENEGSNNIQVNSYCTFTPGGIHNTITGTQTFDANNNGCDALDTHFPSMKVTLNDGTETGATFTNSTGNYNFFMQDGDFVVTPTLENSYFTVSPASATINFAAVDGSTQTQNFCITPLGIHYDAEITLMPIDGASPGFDAPYRIIYKNNGNQILSGNITLTFDDAILDFVAANPSISSQSLNQLNWSYSGLYPFESRVIDFTLNLNSPQEIPAINNGDVLHYVATISSNGQDETPADNMFNFDQIVIGSYDPNDKTCLEGDFITPELVGDYLHYLIRFQNSGTAAAENIVVKDVIDTTKFDMASLQLTSSSHPQVTKITGNKVEFQFQNINLPAEIDDEPGSHGYVAFKIKTKANLTLGNAVANKADIYFDYNFPIETNTATSIVALLGVNQFENTSVAATPNPTKNVVHISSKGNISSVQLYDVQGRLLETILGHDEKLDVDLSSKAKGIYFFKIQTDKGMKVEKIIKE